jgi:hypothetical protein
MSPPWVGWIGSRPFLPLEVSVKPGSLWLVSSEKTHRTCCVSFAQAKLTWAGSDTTFGFWQAVVISFRTVVTLAGQLALPPGSATVMSAIPAAKAAAPIAIARQSANHRRGPRFTCLRPLLMSTSVRSPEPPGRSAPPSWKPPVASPGYPRSARSGMSRPESA